MGLRLFFAKHLLKMIKDAKRIEDERDEEVRTQTAERDRFSHSLHQGSPAIVAFRIANGFLVQSLRPDDGYSGRQPTFHYCKDHQDIAEHIVGEATKAALGLGEAGVRSEQNMAQAKVARSPQVAAQRTHY